MAERRVTIKTASGIKPEATRWLWEGRIPEGAPTILAGREGLGKSTLAVELAARLSRGQLAGDLFGMPAHVVYASAEDAPAATLVPRLFAAGADLERIGLLNVTTGEGDDAAEDSLSLPADIPRLRDLLQTLGARLLILDPLVSYLPSNVKTYSDQHVRRVLAPLARVADELGAAVVCVLHLNKSDSTDALARVGGSVGFTAAARSVLLFAADTHDPDGENGSERVLAHVKCNVGRKRPALAATIEGRSIRGDDGIVIPTSRIVLGDEIDRGASDLLGPPATTAERTALDDAVEFLLAELADGQRTAKEVQAAAVDAGISDRTLNRAKSKAGVKPVKGRKEDGGVWFWKLNGSSSSYGNVGNVGQVGNLAKEAKAAKVSNDVAGRKAA